MFLQRLVNILRDQYHNSRCVSGIKRLLGLSCDEVKELGKTLQYLQTASFKMVQIEHQLKFHFQYNEKCKDLFAEEVAGIILANLKARAEQAMSREISHAVVTVPSHFDLRQRQAMLDAGEIAGLTLRLVNDSTILAVKFCMEQKFTVPKYLLIFISGGGSTEVSIAEIRANECNIIASTGSNHLGGLEIDNEIASYYLKAMEPKNVSKQPTDEMKRRQLRTLQRLLIESEDAKKRLSTASEASINIWYEQKEVLLTRKK